MIVGVSGKARSGKDQLAKYLIEIFKSKYDREFYHIAFAAELKNMCKFQFGLDDDQLYGDKKEIPDNRYLKPHNKWKDEITESELVTNSVTVIYWTPREIMQELGAFYRKINYDFWVIALRKWMEDLERKGHKDYIITDVRHINEAEFIKKENGFLIRIIRESENKIHGIDHESETGLDAYKDFDMIVENNGSLEDLKKASHNIVDAILLIEKLSKDRRII